MVIWHIYVVRGLHRVNGVLNVIERLAAAQAAGGHEVLVLVAQPAGGPLVPGGAPGCPWFEVRPTGREVVGTIRARLAAGDRPDVVHFHEVLRPPHAVIAAITRPIPYVVTTHAGLVPENLDRYRIKKAAYGTLVERRFLRRAAAILTNSEVEREYARAFVAAPVETVAIPNPIDQAFRDAPAWRPAPGRPSVVTLARYDVRQKGLDRLSEIARRVPEADFVVYGRQDHNEPARTRALMREAPENFRLSPPVFGDEKLRVLREAAVFAQPSRWEGMSVALTEALSVGTPCAVSSFVAATMPFVEHGLGLVLADDPEAAAAQLRSALADPARRAGWSVAGRGYAHQVFEPSSICAATIAVYRRAIPHAAPAA